ncbi:MAG: TIM barrel protein [Candidatus Aenigmatarchaeota archaeon]
MKIRIGSSGIPLSCKGGSSAEGVKCISELGLDAMEVAFTHGVYMQIPAAKEFGKVAKELDVELSVHAPYYINLASEKNDVIKASKKRILDSLHRGEAMGATVVVVHGGYYGKDKENAIEMITDACQEISDSIEKNNWKIKLGLETMGKQKSFGTLDEIIPISKKIKNVIPYLDVAHIYAGNAGKIDYKEIFDKLKVLKLKKYDSHFSGINYSVVSPGKGNEKNHVPMAEAGPDFKDFAKEILKRKIDITLISESPVLEQDALVMKGIFEKLGHRF